MTALKNDNPVFKYGWESREENAWPCKEINQEEVVKWIMGNEVAWECVTALSMMGTVANHDVQQRAGTIMRVLMWDQEAEKEDEIIREDFARALDVIERK